MMDNIQLGFRIRCPDGLQIVCSRQRTNTDSRNSRVQRCVFVGVAIVTLLLAGCGDDGASTSAAFDEARRNVDREVGRPVGYLELARAVNAEELIEVLQRIGPEAIDSVATPYRVAISEGRPSHHPPTISLFWLQRDFNVAQTDRSHLTISFSSLRATFLS